jgi:hypothetical protein
LNPLLVVPFRTNITFIETREDTGLGRIGFPLPISREVGGEVPFPLSPRGEKIKDNPIGSARLSGQRHWVNSLNIVYNPNTEILRKAFQRAWPEKKIKILIIYCFTVSTYKSSGQKKAS